MAKPRPVVAALNRIAAVLVSFLRLAAVVSTPRPVVAALFVLSTTCCSAAEIQWKMHTINAQSEFPACAAFDVDHDGDVDIYSGGWWYEAPTWKKHKVRDVEIIRGRYDDYSNQPMDCNGDGWTDIISVNYRSETIYWIEHPGKHLGEQDWTAHVIDKPGPSETGRLHDIDGDGDLDILPNGTTYAAWYEFKPEKKADGTLTPKWKKHDLAKELAGHGIGFRRGPTYSAYWGGREVANEFVGPTYFHCKPEGKENEIRLDSHRRPRIHRDASIPILFLPTDHEDEPDLIWGRGHRFGLYWAERHALKHLSWGKGAIDTSWSQCHAPLLADVDNDGKLDVIAGKRYMGHEGKDPGEFDPLVIYWYKHQKADNGEVLWHRKPIQDAGPAAMDLDAKAIDLDADGDNDLVAPSRNGLYYFENLLINKQQATPTTSNHRKAIAAYKNHSELMVVATANGDLRPVKSPFDWSSRCWHILRNMELVMGPLPATRKESPWLHGNEAKSSSEKYHVRRVRRRNDWDQPDKPYIATLLIPKDRSSDVSLPAMVCLHPTSIPHGHKTVTGEVEAKNRNYAHELAERGYVCICPDYPTMGANSFDLSSEGKGYRSGTMKAIEDNIYCLDVLEDLGIVDPDRIGVIGHSLGGHNGLFTACFDQRIKCVVTSCGFTPFHDYYGGKLAGWTQDRYMPRIRDVYESNPDKMPFDFYEVLGAIAPRPLFINAPLHDDNFDVGGVKKCVAEVQKVYDLLGKPDALQARYPDCAHDFPEEVRKEVYEWLDKQLR